MVVLRAVGDTDLLTPTFLFPASFNQPSSYRQVGRYFLVSHFLPYPIRAILFVQGTLPTYLPMPCNLMPPLLCTRAPCPLPFPWAQLIFFASTHRRSDPLILPFFFFALTALCDVHARRHYACISHYASYYLLSLADVVLSHATLFFNATT
ncbi:uncharacterized protein LY79DRAFT_365989 [Colletotrichum navitas]|uniref:Uncharacterized protein n=1 Tax=Colletotrichum navitas TaxID=681940 RepID=A0AAD8PQR9_9PEZI|nr:uncharacterized protein LY79DRAFT_365989 [Colletotrichum navitas]KAK1574546.1 hypothetical protein LY79DRAFT_365989 [Colletotrichum navitas]